MRAQYEDTAGVRSDSASTDTNGRAERSLPADDLAVVGGKLVTEAVEINSVWHCNINCAWCSHGSPTLPRDFADELVVGRDLRALATWMTVDHVRVLGGEPLLHPRFPRLLEEVRSAQLSDRIRILTNGLMLARAEAAVWDLVDEIHISVYPSTQRTIEAGLRSLKDKAAAAHTTLMLKYFDRFRLTYRLPDDDHSLTERVYRTCQIGNVWRCLTVEHGHLYRCPQAAFQHRFHPRIQDAITSVIQAVRLVPGSEVLIVVNSVTEPSLSVQRDPHLRLLTSSPPGAAAARNTGIRLAQHDAVLFTDDDCLVPPTWCRDLGEALNNPLSAASPAVAAPVTVHATGPITAFLDYRRIFHAPPIDADHVRYPVTANCGLRRDLLPRGFRFDQETFGTGTSPTILPPTSVDSAKSPIRTCGWPLSLTNACSSHRGSLVISKS